MRSDAVGVLRLVLRTQPTRSEFPGKSHSAERGCARSVSRSKLAVSAVHEYPMRSDAVGVLRLVLRTQPTRSEFPGKSHSAERGCARSVSRSKLAVSAVHEYPMRSDPAGLLRLVLRTQPRSGPE